MSMEIVRRIACERENSQLIPSKPRDERQRLRLWGLYELLVVLRIILTLNIQTGWIHQDEFSNSLETVAGDYFDLQVFKSPGFNATFPTRSVTLHHATVYFPYLICNYFLSYTHPIGKELIPNAKLLLLIPRLFNVLMSFFVDYLLVKFLELNDVTNKPTKEKCEQQQTQRLEGGIQNDQNGRSSSSSTSHSTNGNGRGSRNSTQDEGSSSTNASDESNDSSSITTKDYSIQLVTFSSSQVLLVFVTRTHPSSLNLLLFASLLYLVSESFYSYDSYIPILEKYKKAQTPLERVQYLREMKKTKYSCIHKLNLITLIIVIGLFNDPEFFLSYACIPLFFYMQRGISHPLIGMKYFHARIFAFIAYFFLFSIPFILWDSFYFGKLCLNDFRTLNISPESFVATPVNYFAMKDSPFRDLAAYPKIFVMYLLLFNVLGVMGLVSFLKELYDIFFAEWRHKPNMDSHWTFMNCSLFLPLFFLIRGNGLNTSPFDLVPLIFPLVYMHGHKIPLVSRFSYKIGFSWFLCNILGVLFWGYVSQGGIITSFLDLYDKLVPIRFNETHVDITFSQMSAIPPTFILVIPSKWKTVVEKPEMPWDDLSINGDDLPHNLYKTVLKLESTNKVRVFHTGVSPLPMSHLERDLKRLMVSQDEVGDKHRVSFLLIPYAYGRESEETFKYLKPVHVKTYWNHIYMGNLNEECNGCNYFQFGLSLYKIDKMREYRDFKSTNRSKSASSLANITEVEDKLMTMFKFQDTFYEFVLYIVDLCTAGLTFILFFTSYLVFLT
ncbi:unnamed protein product [Orchesella dallaii]|uniref:Mannosyltransferase n=1 Tax=Orchesella dallaii TaxID=48710 RepID=A0ABP1QP76_9HEXA